MSDTRVFPLGHILGPVHAGDDRTPSYHRVRIGADVLNLSPDLAQVWHLAHGPAGPPGPGPDRAWTRADLVAAVRAQDTGDTDEAAAAVADLIGTGAIAEVGPGALEPVRFAEGHRFHPLLLGLGATADRPDRFHIGLIGEPVATVDALTFDLWQWAPRVANLRELAELQATTAPMLGDDIDDGLDYLLWRLQVLLAHGAGHLDVTPPKA